MRISYKHLAFLPVPALLILVFTLDFIENPLVFYDPPWLVLTLNAVFVTAVCLTVSAISLRNYMATGRLQVLLLGCGVFVLAIGGTASAYAIGLPNGVNLAVTIHNTGAFASALFHFISALVLISAFSGFRPKQKRLWLFAGYSGVIIFMMLLMLAGFKGITPLFFIQGEGPTMLRQAVLGSAAVLFAFSFLIFMLTYQKNKEIFLYWYSIALGLNSICFIAVFIQNSVGSPVGWVGRISQYLGGIYFLIAIISAIRSAGERKTSFDDVITSSLRIVEEKLRESEEKYCGLFENINEGFAIGEMLYDETGKAVDYRFIDANSAFEMFIGFPRDQIIGKTIRSILPNVQSKAIEIFGEIDSTGKDAHFENYSRDLKMWFDIYAYRPKPGQIAYLALDITERKNAEEALRESERRLTGVLESMPDAFVSFDTGMRYTYVNANAERLQGARREELLGSDVRDVYLDAESYKTISRYEQVLREQKPMTLTSYHAGFDGWVEMRAFPTPDGVSVFYKSVTAQVRAEEALRESEVKYRAFFENSMDAILITSPDGSVEAANDAACKMFGMTEQEIIQGGRDKAVDLSDPRLRPALEERARTGRFRGELNMKRKDGTIFSVEESNTVFTDRNARLKTVMILRDITERKQAEAALAESEESLRSLAENVPCVLMRFDRQHRVVYLSRQSDRYNPNPVERMTGRTNREIGMPEHLCELWDRAIDRVFSTGAQEEMEFDFAGPSGMRTFSLKFAPEFGPDHEVRYVLGVSSDITERKQAEEALLKAHDELEQRVDERTAELMKRTEQLRNLMLELTNAENRERKRLAIILHDHLQQILVGAKLGNEAVQRQISDNELKKSVKKVSDLLDESIKVSRTLTAELSPPILHEGGLVPGLQWLARWFEEKQGFKVSIIADADIPPDPGKGAPVQCVEAREGK